jgi:ectoine hydroxylase-related dioxygenase (phytanoyl-CoA dioxygenase family)
MYDDGHMPSQLDLEQQIAFESNGFLVIPDALSPQELARVREAADRAEAEWRADAGRTGLRKATLEQVQAPIEYDDVLLELLWHPKVFPVVRKVLGDDVMMIDNDYFITPPRTPETHTDWHHDVGMEGVYHPRSTLMVKVFYLLTDVNENSGGTAMVPGSHRFPETFQFPKVDEPKQMPGMVQMTGKAGTAYAFNGRVYHCAVNNESDEPRRVLIYNYGHNWMRMWPGYEPSDRLVAEAKASGDPIRQQLLGLTPAYTSSLPAVAVS